MSKVRTVGPFLVAGTLLIAACATFEPNLALPSVTTLGSQNIHLKDLADLDARASAVAVVQPTGKTRIELVEFAKGVLPTPVPVVELRVIEVIKGELPEYIEQRVGYTYQGDDGQEVPVISGPARFLLYLEPFDTGDGAPWNGQWVTTAWLSGVFMDLGGDSGTYTRVDAEAVNLPDRITVSEAADPASVPVDIED
jgi:hypothetical protein